MLVAASLLNIGRSQAQVSSYTFSQELGTFQPIGGNGTMIGYNLIDDEVFVIQGDALGFGLQNSGDGWPIGFTFHFDGVPFDRVGLSTEGWLSLGNSSRGAHAVYLPIGGNAAYNPLSTATDPAVDPEMRYRIVPFANDLRARNGIWPLQTRTIGTAPNRTFVVEWNVSSANVGAGGSFAFQVRLAEGGGIPAQQTIKMVYGPMSSTNAYTGQVGLGGRTPADFANRSVAMDPYDWQASTAGGANSATCRIPTAASSLPSGLTYIWAPPACAVAGIQITELNAGATTVTGDLEWLAVPGATSYNYVITAGSPTDTPLASGTGITGTTVAVTGLPLNTELYAYVRANCAPAGVWGSPYVFTTEGVVRVVCGEPPLEQTYCYDHYQQKTWSYASSEGSPLRLIFHEGVISVGDVLICYDGPDANAPVLFNSQTGPLPDQVVNTTGDHLFMQLISDGVGSCANLEFVTPMEWEVGCLDCEPVLANYAAINDCENQEFDVRVTIFDMGSAASVVITNNGGAADVTANVTGQYTVGPFPVGSPVIVTAGNPDNEYCSSISDPTVNTPCPVVSCGPDEYTYCYTEDDAGLWAFQSEANERIGIRFLSGSLAGTDALRIYDGADVFGDLLHASTGTDLAGVLAVSEVGSNTILLEAASTGPGSCIGGQATPWNYIVACYDGCEPPEATFTVQDDCEEGMYTISVDLTSLGSASSVTITGGTAPVVAGVPGVQQLGPFNNGSSVTVVIEGASSLCSLNSPVLHDGCGVGIKDLAEARLGIYPDPGAGPFNVVLPRGFGGGADLEVLDLTGRRVMWERITAEDGQVKTFSLDDVPAGSYVVVLRNTARFVSGTLRVVR